MTYTITENSNFFSALMQFIAQWKVAKKDTHEQFSKQTLAAIEEAKLISRNTDVKSYSSAKALLESCE